MTDIIVNQTNQPPAISLKSIYQEAGVKDLYPLPCRAAFARALKAEREGYQDDASKYLDDAVAAEVVQPA